jgi:hypothetical protein
VFGTPLRCPLRVERVRRKYKATRGRGSVGQSLRHGDAIIVDVISGCEVEVKNIRVFAVKCKQIRLRGPVYAAAASTGGCIDARRRRPHLFCSLFPYCRWNWDIMCLKSGDLRIL